MAERSLSNRIGDIVDQLCTIRHLNEAVHMAASDSNLTTSATNALQALCGEIHRKITSAEEQLEELMEDVKS